MLLWLHPELQIAEIKLWVSHFQPTQRAWKTIVTTIASSVRQHCYESHRSLALPLWWAYIFLWPDPVVAIGSALWLSPAVFRCPVPCRQWWGARELYGVVWVPLTLEPVNFSASRYWTLGLLWCLFTSLQLRRVIQSLCLRIGSGHLSFSSVHPLRKTEDVI